MFSFLCCSQRTDGYTEEEESAATKIQAMQRGKQGRRDFDKYKAAAGTTTEAEDLGGGSGAVPSKLLNIEITSAKGLKDVVGARLRGKKSDPFCYCDVGGVKFQTAIQKNKLAPVWNETFEVVDCPEGASIDFMVVHPAVKKNPEICLGKASIAATDYADGFDAEMKLTDTGLKKGDAFLKVKVSWVDKKPTEKRISAFKDTAVEMWITRYRPIGLRAGPGIAEQRVGIDLKPGEEFGVVEEVEGRDGQQYLRLSDGRGWAFLKSAKDGEILCEKIAEEVVVEADAGVDDPNQETAEAPEEPGAEPSAEPEAEAEQ